MTTVENSRKDDFYSISAVILCPAVCIGGIMSKVRMESRAKVSIVSLDKSFSALHQ